MKNKKIGISFSLLNLFVLTFLIVASLIVVVERTKRINEKKSLLRDFAESREAEYDQELVQRNLYYTSGCVDACWTMRECKLERQAIQGRKHLLTNVLNRLKSSESDAFTGMREGMTLTQHRFILVYANKAIEMLETAHGDLSTDPNFQKPELKSFVQRMKASRRLINFMETFSDPPFEHEGLGFYEKFLRRQERQTKVPGTENETDTVKPKSKSPERPVNFLGWQSFGHFLCDVFNTAARLA